MLKLSCTPIYGVTYKEMIHMTKDPQTIKILKTALGQVESVIRMTEDQRYCLDISTQISASIALLKKAQQQIISNHLNHCVLEALEKGDSKEKINEINQLLKKLL
ncbi:Metal-sensitive transcriptional repressor [Acholeplasma oculi]|uniref:Copper-sensing transcriptional repressor CsoR n=2 Tax=Acholeplasma oculi TaxID=35623 RepID=A0A061AID7_9MOLU|nr:Metal-sensitive transcriptional repressor [Acholeplasma oculi]